MASDVEVLKQLFRQGRHAEAIAACEARCLKEPARAELLKLCANMHVMVGDSAAALPWLQRLRQLAPGDTEVLFNLGMCHRALSEFEPAAQAFVAYAETVPRDPEGWAAAAESTFRLSAFERGLEFADRALQIDAGKVLAWTVRASCQQALGRFPEAVASLDTAVRLAPDAAAVRIQRGDAFDSLGDPSRAGDDYAAALALTPTDGATLKKATMSLLQAARAEEGIRLCRAALKVDPDHVTAKLGIEWLLSQLVPLWHVPMMNEEERNAAYFDGLKSVVAPQKVVFEIGTGSGLLAMMAARLGAAHVYTCEAVPLVATTAARIVERNRLQDRVRVLSKPSFEVQIGADLPAQADVLVHEIFSSELLGEHVLRALEDAKARLLKPGGEVLPSAASIMIALLGGDEIGREIHVTEAFGFDLSPFNEINPKKRPIHREDLPRVLLSDAVEAFRFDFGRDANFPVEKKRLQLTATSSGLCFGVIQWIRFELGPHATFENHPTRRRPVASWQQTIYRFDAPLAVQAGMRVAIDALHDRIRPWFDLAPAG